MYVVVILRTIMPILGSVLRFMAILEIFSEFISLLITWVKLSKPIKRW